jgi:putative protein kinase ArgK-like GTPase of G3E family
MPLDGMSPIDAYHKIRAELEAYSPKLAAKAEILAANKMDLAGASEALADLRQALPGKQIFAISAVAGTGLRPLLEALWQQVKNTPEAQPLVEERPYVPPPMPNKRSEEEMFQYATADDDPDAWEAVDGESQALEPQRVDTFIDALGEKVPPPKNLKRKKSDKPKRTLIEPANTGPKRKTRRSAKERREAHEARIKRKFAPPPEPPPAPAEPDAELAAEIEAMKADDLRKGKYYNRKKTDV